MSDEEFHSTYSTKTKDGGKIWGWIEGFMFMSNVYKQ